MEDRLPYTDTLVAAHRGEPAPSTASASTPADYAAAMRIQREVTRALGATVAGWKVGFSPEGVPVAGPLYASVVRAEPGSRFAA